MRHDALMHDVAVGAALTVPVFHPLTLFTSDTCEFRSPLFLISFVRIYFSFVLFAHKDLAIEKPGHWFWYCDPHRNAGSATSPPPSCPLNPSSYHPMHLPSCIWRSYNADPLPLRIPSYTCHKTRRHPFDLQHSGES